tara:strand:- start:1421 stop:1711 length:291 start_codon:yes stop_codon:yes gene_type:complete
MADNTLIKRKVQISSEIFGGFYVYINLDEYSCTCDIEDYVKAVLCSSLMNSNLTNLAEMAMNTDFDIHTDFDELKMQNTFDTVWVCDGCKVEGIEH